MTTVRFTAYDLPVLSAAKATVPGRAEPMNAIAFGTDVETADFYAVSIADAHRLRWALDAALASSPPDPEAEVIDRAHL